MLLKNKLVLSINCSVTFKIKEECYKNKQIKKLVGISAGRFCSHIDSAATAILRRNSKHGNVQENINL